MNPPHRYLYNTGLIQGIQKHCPPRRLSLTPPVSRINPGAEQILRIRLTDKNSMPSDRESLWWLNVLDIPPVSETSSLKEKTQDNWPSVHGLKSFTALPD